MALGLTLMWATAGADDIGWLLPGLVVDGLGMGMVLAPLTSTVLTRVTPQNAGSAAGVLSTVQQVGNALGVALIGIVFYSVHGYVHGFEISLLTLAVLELTLAAMIQFLPRT
jgi:MFS family permease